MNILNYIKINDQIATAGQPAKEGFEVVINLAMHNKGALKKEDKIVSKNGMMYIHLPITWKAPKVDRLKLFLILLESLERENKKIFIHCIMNYRASVFMYLYKKFVWKASDDTLIAPAEYEPNEVWQEILNINMRERYHEKVV